jgi:predicted aspartyl protease
MIEGYFNSQGELFFHMDLMAVDHSLMTVDAMLDTGFTDWLAMNLQDIDSLGWSYLKTLEKQTAGGIIEFNLYAGTVFFDDQEMTIPVIGGNEFTHILMGLQWLNNRRLIVDRKKDWLTLEKVN